MESLQIKLLFVLFWLSFMFLVKKEYGKDKIFSKGFLYIIVTVLIIGAAWDSNDVYTYTTEEKTIPTVDFISISTNKDNFIIKYKNQKGKSKKLKLSDNCKITYKTSNVNKSQYPH